MKRIHLILIGIAVVTATAGVYVGPLIVTKRWNPSSMLTCETPPPRI